MASSCQTQHISVRQRTVADALAELILVLLGQGLQVGHRVLAVHAEELGNGDRVALGLWCFFHYFTSF